MTRAQKPQYRARRDSGDVVLSVPVNLNTVSAVLEHLGVLDPRNRDDRAAVAQALAHQLDILAAAVTGNRQHPH